MPGCVHVSVRAYITETDAACAHSRIYLRSLMGLMFPLPSPIWVCPKVEWVGPLLPRAGPKVRALGGGAH